MIDKTEQELRRAERATAILDNDAFMDALKFMRDEAMTTFKDCPIRDTQGMQLIQMHLKCIDKFEASLRGWVETGKMAKYSQDRSKAGNFAEKAANILRFN
jgi:hypothetical protein